MAAPHQGLMRARVLVRPKEGILDPQGQTVERALKALGFAGVRNVHVGRVIELELDDPARLPEMCNRLLANPLIEDWEIEDGNGVSGASPEDSGATTSDGADAEEVRRAG